MLSVDGKEVDCKKIPHTIPLLMAIDETFDVGVDIRTEVDDHEYRTLKVSCPVGDNRVPPWRLGK